MNSLKDVIDMVKTEAVENGCSSGSSACSMPIARIERRLVSRIGVREWGLPTLAMPGKVWRSRENDTMTCMVPHSDPAEFAIETLPLEVIEPGELSEIPDHWRDAMWEYVQAYPASGHGLAPFLRITEEQRCDFIRTQAEFLVRSDNIGCRSIAHMIGDLASIEFELVH